MTNFSSDHFIAFYFLNISKIIEGSKESVTSNLMNKFGFEVVELMIIYFLQERQVKRTKCVKRYFISTIYFESQHISKGSTDGNDL